MRIKSWGYCCLLSHRVSRQNFAKSWRKSRVGSKIARKVGESDSGFSERMFSGSFQQGQPEIQQAMDNMVIHKTAIQKRTNQDKVPPKESPKDMGQKVNEMKKFQEVNEMKKFQEVNEMKKFQDVNFKTSNLLAEAEKVLKTLPESKERQWVESFVERMREIAKMLETTAKHKNMAKVFASTKDTPVRDGFPKQPTEPATSAVPEINPFQKPIIMTSKIQMTSPEINRVLPEDEQSEHQAVTKPVALSNKVDEAESDELVWELESLHEEKTHKNLSEQAKPSKESKANDVNQAKITTTPSTSLSQEANKAISVNEMIRNLIKRYKQEAETAKLKARLIEEIEEFHRRGGIMPKEVLDILNADSHKLKDPVQNRKINIEEEMKFTEAGMKDRRGMMKLDDLNNDDREISMANMRNMPPYAAHQFQYLRYNHTFPYKYPNFVQGFPQQMGHYFQNIPPLYKAQPYQGRPQNMVPSFQKMSPYNQGKYHDLDMLPQQGYNPGVLTQRLFKPHISYNGRLPPPDYQNYFMRHNYGPYPYMHNWNPQNSTLQLPQMMPSYPNNQAKINAQLSDEMKRELRDGKIIVLSDSVVRTNFEPDNKEKTTQSATEKAELMGTDMKNETITEN